MHWQGCPVLASEVGGWCPVEGHGKVARPLGVVECLVGGGDLETGPRQKRHNTAGDFRSVDHGRM